METPPLRMKIDDDTELRLLGEDDAQVLFDLIDQNRVYLREWLPWVDFTHTAEDELTFIRSVQAQYDDNHSFGCSIWYRGQVAGTISYHPIYWSHRKVEIGYWLGAQFQGKGIMTKACITMVEYAFTSLLLNNVEIRCAVGNTRSRAIPERLGFKQEGLIRQGEWLYDHFVDLVLYSMSASDWQKKRA